MESKNRIGAQTPSTEDKRPWSVIQFLYRNPDYVGQTDNYVRTSRYTVMSFIPLTIIENFRILTNVYFLLVLFLSMLPYSPMNFIYNLNPLLFVLLISMGKSGVEDYYKHKQDDLKNSTRIERFFEGEWISIESKSIQAGDLIKVKSGQMIPCDFFYLTSSSESRICNYTESNLNGESAVKTMNCHVAFKDSSVPECFQTDAYEIHMPEPDNDLYVLNAKLVSGTKVWPVSIHNVLLRGMILQYTDWIMGIAIRTGHDCKIMKNQRHPPSKITAFDKNINQMIIFLFIFKMMMITALAFSCSRRENSSIFPLLRSVSPGYKESFLQAFFQYFVLYSYMVPISLMVTVEIIRAFHVIIIYFDHLMVDSEFGNAETRNSNMIGQLGLVTHVLSDKTGTLTENIMQVVSFIDENGSFGANDFAENIKFNSTAFEKSYPLLLSMALCNTVVVYQNPNGVIEYNAESPDEAAFVKFASKCGLSLVSRKPEQISFDQNGEIISFEIVSIIPFNSERKRMTIVAKCDGSDQLVVFSKGADNIMFPLCNQVLYSAEINNYALCGYRTLVFAQRILTVEESLEWTTMYSSASSLLEGRENAIFHIAPYVENCLNIVGCTAVEDKLQPDVYDSIEWLRRAKIGVWILTGDKLETAIEIGKTSGVIDTDSDVLILSSNENHHFLSSIQEYKNGFSTFRHPVLVLNEKSADLALKNPHEFISLAFSCMSVVFSRVSPFMKAAIVALVKDQPNTLTIAIGDGANDVGMIQESHVGIGVMGREGSQAAQSADFAIPRFRHLVRLIAVHGHWSLNRFTSAAMFMLYKNLVFILVYFWSSFDTLSSPSSFYNDFYLSCYNLVFTLFPPFAFGFFEQDIPQQALLKYPILHRSLVNPMGVFGTIYHVVLSIIQSLIIYLVVRFAYYDQPLEVVGNFCYVLVVLVVTFQMSVWTKHWTSWNYVSIFGTILLLYILSLIYAFFLVPSMLGVMNEIMTTFKSWITLILATFFSLAPSFCFELFMDLFYPSLSRLLRERENLDSNDPLDFTKSMHIIPAL